MSYFFSDTECFTFASHVSNMIAYGNAVILYIEGHEQAPFDLHYFFACFRSCICYLTTASVIASVLANWIIHLIPAFKVLLPNQVFFQKITV